VSVKLHHVDGGPEWWLTSVYGLVADTDKDSFLAELHDLRQVWTGSWMINGDFNLICRVEYKNNDRLNRRHMGQFRRFLNDATLQEIHLNGRLFTWSNEKAHPILERIDRMFISNEWDAIFLDHVLHSLSSLCSDHAPLLLRTEDEIQAKRWFHFCSF
jgi:endonuclease/exonuclease/phosphatase family metal-dependent hydrolase